jgi:hypothetical protein
MPLRKLEEAGAGAGKAWVWAATAAGDAFTWL